MLKQTLNLKQHARLSPLQMKLMKLIQLPALALEQKIKEELIENPTLEEGAEEVEAELEEQEETQIEDEETTEEEAPEEKEAEEEINLDDYIQDDEIPDYKTKANNTGPDEELKTKPIVVSVSFQDFLLSQTGMCDFTEAQEKIAEHLIGSMDDDGYMRRPFNQISNDLAFAQNVMVAESEIEDVLRIIQTFDPPGIGARDLKECLLLQLHRKKNQDELTLQAIHILEKFFEEFSNKNYAKILRDTNIDEERLKEIISEIVRLNPKPGEGSGESAKTQQTISPDFVIVNNEGKLELNLITGNIPELRVSRYYQEMLRDYQNNKQKSKADKEAILFVKHKLEAAHGFIEAINERHRTLIKTMTAILEYQYDYFLTGDETKLKPMVLKDIAAITDYDISTISRVTNSKYVQTPHGIYMLKFFFSERVKTDSGEEASAREVKRIILNFLESEDKKNPLTDEQLMHLLREKKYKLARRTIAKYRELLKIPTARMRKEM